MAVSAVEKELTKLTKLKPDKYDDRQDYLAAIARALERISNDDYDSLTDPAANWHKAACDALNDKEEVPNFDGTLSSAEGAEPEAEDAPSIEDDDPEAAEDTLEDEPPAKKAKPTKAAKPAKVAKAEKPEKPKKQRPQVDYEALTGEKDRFGVTKGTKTSLAVSMYNRKDGATVKQIDEATGGRYMNVLTKLQKDGHLVEKDGKFWKLTHREDIVKKKGK